jgi:hypothetical protein
MRMPPNNDAGASPRLAIWGKAPYNKSVERTQLSPTNLRFDAENIPLACGVRLYLEMLGYVFTK